MVCQQQALSAMLHEDIKVRDFLKKKLSHAAVSRS
jgi:ribosomal protein S3